MDELIRVLGAGGHIRAVVARTTGIVETLRRIHDTSPPVTAALGRVATGALLLASTLEKTATAREPIVTIEIEGDGPAGKVLATASPAGWTRGLVKNPLADMPARHDGKLNVGGVIGKQGTFSVARDIGAGQPYRGVVPLVNGEIALDMAHYLRDSEQMPSGVALGVLVGSAPAVLHAGGVLVQTLPGATSEDAEQVEQRMIAFGDVTAHLKAGEGPDAWLEFLFPDGFEIVDRHPVEFRCGCSLDRVERALKLLGARELREILLLAEHAPARVTCEFCHREYALPKEHVARLLAEVQQERPVAEA